MRSPTRFQATVKNVIVRIVSRRKAKSGISVNVMPREKSIRSGWRCDNCGERISALDAGWVEWLAAEDAKGRPIVGGLRLVHRHSTTSRSREPNGCQYNPLHEFRKNRGIIEGLALDRFAGPDGLMLLLSLIAERELPARELIELAKRVQIPGYEAVYELAHDAVREGVIAPSISSGFYLQCEISDVMRWAKYRTSARRDTGKRSSSCVISQ